MSLICQECGTLEKLKFNTVFISLLYLPTILYICKLYMYLNL